MIERRLIDTFIDRLYRLQAPEDFRTLWANTTQALGFSSFTYVGARLDRDQRTGRVGQGCVPVYLTTVDPRWEEEYIRSAFFGLDPIVKEALARPLPIVSLELQKRRELTADELAVLERGQDYALSRTLTIPIHALGGEIGIMSLYCMESEAEFLRCLHAYQHSIHVMAIHFHTAVQEKLGYDNSVLRILKLTPRELECLHWTAKGKTAWEIGQILCISEDTVNKHIRNAIEKLRVSNRTHAVAKAVSIGLTAP